MKIPITIGKSRLRGNSAGAMVDKMPGESHLNRLEWGSIDGSRDNEGGKARSWLKN